MANCYVILKLPSYYVYVTEQSQYLSDPYTFYDSTTATVTIPSGLTITAASIIPTRTITQSNTLNCSIGQVTNFTRFNNTDDIYDNETTITTPTSGNTYSLSFNTSLSNIVFTSTTFTISYIIKFDDLIKLTVTIPTTEEIITAEKLNQFAAIFNTATVTQGNSIIRTPWQNIGTAVGNMTTTATGTTHATAVTFDSTKPLSNNLSSVITNMTNKYYTINL